MEQQTATPTATRPGFLTVLCILSWIWQGIAAVLYLLVMTAGAVVEGAAAAAGADTSGTGNMWLYLGLGFTSIIVAFIGVLKMWKLQKVGFFMYVGAFALSTINDVIYDGISMAGLIIGGAFIAMYAINLKAMK